MERYKRQFTEGNNSVEETNQRALLLLKKGFDKKSDAIAVKLNKSDKFVPSLTTSDEQEIIVYIYSLKTKKTLFLEKSSSKIEEGTCSAGGYGNVPILQNQKGEYYCLLSDADEEIYEFKSGLGNIASLLLMYSKELNIKSLDIDEKKLNKLLQSPKDRDLMEENLSELENAVQSLEKNIESFKRRIESFY